MPGTDASTRKGSTTRSGARDRPLLVVVDPRTPTRKVVARALRRRFGKDYRVVEAKSADEGRAELRRLHEAGLDVAIIAASMELGGDCTAFLAGTREDYPTARRLVLSPVGDNCSPAWNVIWPHARRMPAPHATAFTSSRRWRR